MNIRGSGSYFFLGMSAGFSQADFLAAGNLTRYQAADAVPADLNQFSSCSWFTTPAGCVTGRPPLNTTKSGIPPTLYRAATCGLRSVSTLTTTDFPAISAAAPPTCGAANR